MVDRERIEALQAQVDEMAQRLNSGEETVNPATSPLVPEMMRIAAEVLKLKTELVSRQVAEDPLAAQELTLLTGAVVEHAKDFTKLAAAIAVAQAIHARERN